MLSQDEYITRPRESRRRKLSKAQRAALKLPVRASVLSPIQKQILRGLNGDPAGGSVAAMLARRVNRPTSAGELHDARQTLLRFADIFPRQSRNAVLLSAVSRLSGVRKHWLRKLEDWSGSRPASRSARANDVGTTMAWGLACHLLCRDLQYPPPLWMQGAWVSNDPFARPARRWFVHVAAGGNLRRAPDLPYALTAKMAHFASLAPARLSCGAALRFGHARALGIDNEPAAVVIASTRLSLPMTDEEHLFSNDIMAWFSHHWRGYWTHADLLVGYLFAMRFGEFGLPDPLYQISIDDDPDLLIRYAQDWETRRQILREQTMRWASCGIPGYEEVETDLFGKSRVRIVELRSAHQLREEGDAMDHCVYSYASRAATGQSAIYSLRRRIGLKWVSSTTIEIVPAERVVLQARAASNRAPSERDREVIFRWASNAGLTTDIECFFDANYN